MILIQNSVISDDIADKYFVCDLDKCKGACCVEGDLGAPLEDDELVLITEAYQAAKPYMTARGIEAVEKQGHYIKDHEGDFSIGTVPILLD